MLERSSILSIASRKKKVFFYMEKNFMLFCGFLGSFKTKVNINVLILLKNQSIYVTAPLIYQSRDLINCKKKHLSIFIRNGQLRLQFGLVKSILYRLATSCSKGYKAELELIGIGFKWMTHLNLLVFKIGYSHLVRYYLPLEYQIRKEGRSRLSFYGLRQDTLNNVVSIVQRFRVPNIYSGKGIRFKDQKLILKEGKKSQA